MLELVRPRTIICDEEVETKMEKLVAELEMTIKVITFEGDFFLRTYTNEQHMKTSSWQKSWIQVKRLLL